MNSKLIMDMMKVAILISSCVTIIFTYLKSHTTPMNRVRFYVAMYDLTQLIDECQVKKFGQSGIRPEKYIVSESDELGFKAQYHNFKSSEEAMSVYEMIKSDLSQSKKAPRGRRVPAFLDMVSGYKEFAVCNKNAVTRVLFEGTDVLVIEGKIDAEGNDSSLSVQRYLGY